MMIISTNEPLGGENKRGTPTKKRTRADSFSQNGNDCDHDQGRKKRDGFRLPPFRSHLTLPFNPISPDPPDIFPAETKGDGASRVEISSTDSPGRMLGGRLYPNGWDGGPLGPRGGRQGRGVGQPTA